MDLSRRDFLRYTAGAGAGTALGGERCVAQGESDGGHRAMALSIWHEWQMASSAGDVSAWLSTGARSDDREGASDAT